MHLKTAAAAALLAMGLACQPAAASTIVPGFNANTLPRNDDDSTGLVGLGFTFNFFGTSYTQLYVNNNGNVTFDNPLSTFTPFPLLTTNRVIIAPFFADVDTRGTSNGSQPVTFGTGTFGGQAAFGVNWINVGYYNQGTDKLNSFQLLIVDRSDISAGDADIYFLTMARSSGRRAAPPVARAVSEATAPARAFRMAAPSRSSFPARRSMAPSSTAGPTRWSPAAMSASPAAGCSRCATVRL